MVEQQKEHLMKYLEKGVHFDGRHLTEYREVVVETDISKSAEGSARVKIGDTEVLAGVKLAVEQPYPDTPDQGNLMVNAELLPLSNPAFEPGPPTEQAIELARIVDRGIRESKAIDQKKLCIVKGEKVWSIMIDICTINDDGNLLDASALAALAALKNTRFPAYDGEKIDYMTKTTVKLPIVREPIAITVVKIGNFLLLDPSFEEEKLANSRLTVTVTKEGNICALQKGGDEPLELDEIERMVKIALEKAP
ncbi:MAG: exosome complex protein Rrp42, partial [Candidatus Woesearchaeota archaeon]